MKICSKCKQELDEKNFKRKKDGLQSYCIKCQKEYRKKHYLKNREKYRTKAKKWKKDFRIWWKEYKSNLYCIKCGMNHPACLVFHHRDPEEKEDNLARLINNASKERILEEIKKCDVLCANCHHILHWEMRS